MKAYHTLSNAISRPSFLLVYAAFMFDLLPMPVDIQDAQYPSVDKLELLDRTLQQMQILVASVESFCTNLNSDSTYRAILLACLRVVKWHGYVRDTIALVTCERPCVLDNVPWNPPGKSRMLTRTTNSANESDQMSRRHRQYLTQETFQHWTWLSQPYVNTHAARYSCFTDAHIF